MKLKVNKEFVDRINGELRKVGDTFEVDEARGNELLSHEGNFVSLVKPSKKPSNKK